MTDKENEVKALSEKLFDLYETKRNSSLLNSPQGYEERKKAYIDISFNCCSAKSIFICNNALSM